MSFFRHPDIVQNHLMMLMSLFIEIGLEIDARLRNATELAEQWQEEVINLKAQLAQERKTSSEAYKELEKDASSKADAADFYQKAEQKAKAECLRLSEERNRYKESIEKEVEELKHAKTVQKETIKSRHKNCER